MFDAEAAEQNAEISKKLNEDFKEGIREMHRDLLQEVRIFTFSKLKNQMINLEKNVLNLLNVAASLHEAFRKF